VAGEGLVAGPVRHAVEAGERRQVGTRASGDDEVAPAEFARPHGETSGSGDAPVPAHHGDALALQVGRTIAVVPPGDPVAPRDGGGVGGATGGGVNVARLPAHAQPRGIAQECLARHAGHEGTLAPDARRLDDRDSLTGLGQRPRHPLARRARAEDDGVESFHWSLLGDMERGA
jgi:hypothetical protein